MQIPKNALRRWEGLREHGDIKSLAVILGKSRVTIDKILSTGEATVEQAEAIDSFYKAREARAKKIA